MEVGCMSEDDGRRLGFVLSFQILVALAAFGALVYFWRTLCPAGFDECLVGDGSSAGLFILSILRPFFLTPLFVLIAIVPDDSLLLGSIVLATGSALSALLLASVAEVLSRRHVTPWLEANVPASLSLVRSWDLKVVLGLRWIPYFPLDVLSVLFGIAGVRKKTVFIGTFFGVLPEIFVVHQFGKSGGGGFLGVLSVMSVWWILWLLPLVAYEFFVRTKGGSLWSMTRSMMEEVRSELRQKNEFRSVSAPSSNIHNEGNPQSIRGRPLAFDCPDHLNKNTHKRKILILYGFFSSRRAIDLMEESFLAAGHEVLSFDMGGFFGVFNTRDIKEVARDVRSAVASVIGEGEKVEVVAHSKGGLVALWWILKLGGARYVNNVFTLGTPFAGSLLALLGALSPVGLAWRDLWQMRPGSGFLRDLSDSVVPEGLRVWIVSSTHDKVVGERSGFNPHAVEDGAIVKKITIRDVTHFGFLDDPNLFRHILGIIETSKIEW
jgi:uncharacterized membrane protein YdjX (TVP38/TMEM64 family)/pimeloyl-ACP methyl ester carboxylesterase